MQAIGFPRGSESLHQICGLFVWYLLKLQGTFRRTFAASEKCPEKGFLSDEELSSGLVYRLITLLYYHVARFFHAYETVGIEKLPPKGEGALLVTMHTTHNVDIFTCATMVSAVSGRAPRGLIHRRVYQFHPWVKHVGMVPGNRSTAVDFLRQGLFAACMPGGGEEAMVGHENAYTLGKRWEDRRGYAHVAKEAGVKIYPCFTRNCEEMRFNPFFWLANRLNVGKAYDSLVTVPVLGEIIKQIAMPLWFTMSWWAVPVPVKVTTFIGDPIDTQDLSPDEIAITTHKALQKLIDEKQPHGHSYRHGLTARFKPPTKLE